MKNSFKHLIIFISFFYCTKKTFSQSYPLFGPAIKVNITGLGFDAMEPFLSADENTLFFNSLNSGGNTNLYYATKVNDSTFNFIGLVNGCYDSSVSHLDAVASMDSLNRFYWVSLRGYPTNIENLHVGNYAGTDVINFKRVYGDFNIYLPGWLIMDAAINHQGNMLYYVNAYFNSCSFGLPCEAKIGIAKKINDSTFAKQSNSDVIFSAINDTNYLVYAPQVTSNGLTLFYTRLLKSTVNTELCVAVRSDTSAAFSTPYSFYSNLGQVPEATSPNLTGQKIYYHQKDISGLYCIYLRYKTGINGVNDLKKQLGAVHIFPNPTTDYVTIEGIHLSNDYTITLHTIYGQQVNVVKQQNTIKMTHLNSGIYILSIQGEFGNKQFYIIKNR